MTPFPHSLLDTDSLSLILRQDPTVLSNARQYLQTHSAFSFSIITRFEILRGLKAKQASTQLRAFDTFCAASQILPIVDETVIRASDIYAELHRNGNLVGDADILIAATAMTNSLVLVTNNEKHFQRINDLKIENWLRMRN